MLLDLRSLVEAAGGGQIFTQAMTAIAGDVITVILNDS